MINYGEVLAGSWQDFGLHKNAKVEAGQPIARVGKIHDSSMCHFETYVSGTTKNQRYLVGSKPEGLLDPTKYLLHLAANGH